MHKVTAIIAKSQWLQKDPLFNQFGRSIPLIVKVNTSLPKQYSLLLPTRGPRPSSLTRWAKQAARESTQSCRPAWQDLRKMTTRVNLKYATCDPAWRHGCIAWFPWLYRAGNNKRPTRKPGAAPKNTVFLGAAPNPHANQPSTHHGPPCSLQIKYIQLLHSSVHKSIHAQFSLPTH